MEDYDSLKYAFDSLKRHSNATNFAVKKLEEQNAELRNKLIVLEGKNKQLILKARKTSKVINQTINKSNIQNNEYLEEINRLRKEIECLSQ